MFYLATAPLLQMHPRQIVRLRIVVAQFPILAVDHLLDLG